MYKYTYIVHCAILVHSVEAYTHAAYSAIASAHKRLFVHVCRNYTTIFIRLNHFVIATLNTVNF